MAGDGVRNPADLTPVLDNLDDIDAAIEVNRLLILIVQAGIAEVLDAIDTLEWILLVALGDMSVTLDAILVDTTAIRAQTDGLPVLTETGGTITTDGNVQDLYINNAPGGVFRPICVKIDFTNHTAGETVVITTNYRITAVGGLTLQDTVTFAGVPASPLININLEPNRFG
ncbi:unnamed protein product, partial [marine sediment metagenome]